ncbi:MAG: SH3 domain-containing protein [Acidobacteria bacterium]|nr:SH3 domain-containing protein [Acidobacteriota bacterium]
MICPKCSGLNDDTNIFCIICGETFHSSTNLPSTVMGPQNPLETIMPTQIFQPPPAAGEEFLSTPTVFGVPPNYNQSQAGFNQPPPGFDQSQAGFNQSQANFNQSQANFNQSQAGFNQSQAGFNPSFVGFNPVIPQVQPEPPKSRWVLWLGLGGVFVILLGCGIAAAVFFLYRPTGPAEVLPDHLGLFFQNGDKTAITELAKKDYANALDGKDKLLKDESLPEVESRPNLILYSDGKDIPVGDLKLVQLDTIKNDGKLKQVEFKVTPVDGKPEMKRLWLTENLAKGKYAFALFDGFLDEGKHKLWAFQVKNSDRTDNASLLKELTVAPKSKDEKKEENSNTATPSPSATATPKPTVAPPVGARTAYAGTNNVLVRSAPSLDAAKVNALRNGQKVYILGFSDNYDYWNGLEGNWAHVQTEGGQRGWVFSPLLRY